MKTMLNIVFWCYNPTYKPKHAVSIAKSNVTIKGVEALVNAFSAPDFAGVQISFNGNKYSVLASKGFDREDFAKWWKRKKLGL